MKSDAVPQAEAVTEKISEYIALLDCLQTNGVDALHAVRYVQSLVASDPTVSEVYGRGGIVNAANPTCRNLSMQGLSALDLRAFKGNGEPWDFTRAKDRAWAPRLLREHTPKWVIASPPCTRVPVPTWKSNFPKMSS